MTGPNEKLRALWRDPDYRERAQRGLRKYQAEIRAKARPHPRNRHYELLQTDPEYRDQFSLICAERARLPERAGKVPMWTDDQVRYIRSRLNSGSSPSEIGEALGITNFYSIYAIKYGKTYKHVT